VNSVLTTAEAASHSLVPLILQGLLSRCWIRLHVWLCCWVHELSWTMNWNLQVTTRKALRSLASGPYPSKKNKARGLYSSVALHYTINKNQTEQIYFPTC